MAAHHHALARPVPMEFADVDSDEDRIWLDLTPVGEEEPSSESRYGTVDGEPVVYFDEHASGGSSSDTRSPSEDAVTVSREEEATSGPLAPPPVRLPVPRVRG